MTMEMRTLAALLIAALLLSFGCVQGILQSASPKTQQAGETPPNPNSGQLPSNYTESEDTPPPPPSG